MENENTYREILSELFPKFNPMQIDEIYRKSGMIAGAYKKWIDDSPDLYFGLPLNEFTFMLEQYVFGDPNKLSKLKAVKGLKDYRNDRLDGVILGNWEHNSKLEGYLGLKEAKWVCDDIIKSLDSKWYVVEILDRHPELIKCMKPFLKGDMVDRYKDLLDADKMGLL